MRKNIKTKESLYIKAKPVIAIVCLVSFTVAMVAELVNYFIPIVLPQVFNGSLLMLAIYFVLLAYGTICTGGRQPRWWCKLRRRHRKA